MTVDAPMLIDADALALRLPMLAAIDALHEGFARTAPSVVPQRLHLEVEVTWGEAAECERERADLLVMPAAADGWAGTKLVGVVPGNPSRGLPQVTASYVLLGPPGLVPRAVIDGAALTELRTAAVSGLATRLCARPESRRVAVVGAGVQARAHVLAMAAVLTEADVTVIARDATAVRGLVDHVRAAGCEVPIVAGDRDALRSADVVCVATSSATPVVTLADLPEGVHINAVGAHRPDRRELTADVVAAARVLVGTRASALSEKGDLLLAELEGAWSPDAIVAELSEATSGAVTVRTDPAQRTLFASVGHALEDLIVARAVVEAD